LTHPHERANDALQRGALLDRYCADIGRDPAAITRSIHLPAPYPADVAHWLTEREIVHS
jgi:hypothetical protein